MALVRVENDELIVEMEGFDKLWSLKSRLTIPLAHVRGATADPGAVKDPKGIRTGGTYWPGVIVAGTFRVHGERVFWDVHDPAQTVVIELADEHYARLIIGVADPRATVDLIEHALPRH